MALHIQYLGFELKPRGRVYSYRVLNTKSEAREFTLTISNQAFLDSNVPYQDAASLCYQKLQRELVTETAERPLPNHYTISAQDLDDYRHKYRPAKKQRSW
ncbi:MAG TPA: hypothetical protein VG204_15460 [Terriglobia bacterium]|nr:hypothetical protein [Terriglobia bacterium]